MAPLASNVEARWEGESWGSKETSGGLSSVWSLDVPADAALLACARSLAEAEEVDVGRCRG
eukprot:4543260-Prymnesium_polylepis.1